MSANEHDSFGVSYLYFWGTFIGTPFLFLRDYSLIFGVESNMALWGIELVDVRL